MQLLFEWATSFADKAGIVCYSESDSNTVALYLRNGFNKFDVIKLTDKDKCFSLEALIREPKKPSI